MTKTDWQLTLKSPKDVIVTFFWQDEEGWQRSEYPDGRFDVWDIRFPGTDTFHGFVVWVMKNVYELIEEGGWKIQL